MLPRSAKLNPSAQRGCRGTTGKAPALRLPGSIRPRSQFMRSSVFAPKWTELSFLSFPAHGPPNRTFFHRGSSLSSQEGSPL